MMYHSRNLIPAVCTRAHLHDVHDGTNTEKGNEVRPSRHTHTIWQRPHTETCVATQFPNLLPAEIHTHIISACLSRVMNFGRAHCAHACSSTVIPASVAKSAGAAEEPHMGNKLST
eukprot:NODE_116_length_2071_cov_196.300595.p3 GENE.NODE_116_length_2071_cov_196.300595~~NODE_116_length_2071_cov_196.300595.p3  ORF type:complete len:116 (-),score=2.90 NODE_116_length_2071_cov_196.300595:1489-1836(-)